MGVGVWCVGMLLGVWGNTLCECVPGSAHCGVAGLVASWCVGVVCENWRVDASIDQACFGAAAFCCVVVLGCVWLCDFFLFVVF